MVPVESKKKAQVLENPSQKLNATALQQVTDILEESEKVAETRNPATNHWFYSMPFAGVRYYSY